MLVIIGSMEMLLYKIDFLLCLIGNTTRNELKKWGLFNRELLL